MAKRFYCIGGTMGVGKTTVCRALRDRLPRSVFLDGDWCWDMHPFQVTDETKRMVMDNIAHLLNNFLRCSAFDHVIFCWVMHEQAIVDDLFVRLDLGGAQACALSLVCTPEALRARLSRDVEAGLRQPDVIARSLVRLPLYAKLQTRALDVTRLSPDEAADCIARDEGGEP